MRYTLLELTQSVLSSIGGDEINSITDTTEATQVVEIIKSVYDEIVSRGNLPAHKILFNLDASGDNTKPVLMTKPSTIVDIEWIRYNRIQTGDTDPAWADLIYKPIDEFILYTQSFNTTESNVDSMTITNSGFTFTFNFKNDVSPTYYTSFNDDSIIFDSYDSAVDTALQTAKTLCFGTLENVFTESDSWTPNLQPQQFTLLLNEAKSLAWAELKQAANNKAEQGARRGWTHLQASRRSIPKYINTTGILNDPDFGRK